MKVQLKRSPSVQHKKTSKPFFSKDAERGSLAKSREVGSFFGNTPDIQMAADKATVTKVKDPNFFVRLGPAPEQRTVFYTGEGGSLGIQGIAKLKGLKNSSGVFLVTVSPLIIDVEGSHRPLSKKYRIESGQDFIFEEGISVGPKEAYMVTARLVEVVYNGKKFNEGEGPYRWFLSGKFKID